jgi:hypothetical protein
LLGATIVLFAWAFAFGRGCDWRAVKKIIHLPGLATAIILAGSWFGYIFWKQGAGALNVFFDDQVTGNFHGHWWSPIGRAPLFALVLIFNFLPWSATAVEWLLRKNGGAAVNVSPLAQKFILAWTALLIAGFALGEDISLRYLLPVTPLLAVLLADWLRSAEQMQLIVSARRILKIVLAALVLAIAAAFFIDSQWPLPTVLFGMICGLFLFGVVVLGLGALWRKSFSASEALGLAILLGWVTFFTAAMPILLPDRAQQIAATLWQTQTDSAQPVLLIGDVKLASRVRVLLGKNWTVAQTDKLNLAAAAKYTCVLISEKEIHPFLGGGWRIQTAAVGLGAPTRGEIWAALKSRRLPEAFTRHAQKICLVTH